MLPKSIIFLKNSFLIKTEKLIEKIIFLAKTNCLNNCKKMYKAILEKKILNYLNSNSHVMIFSDLSKVKNLKILQKKLNVISHFIYFLIINKKNIILPTFNLLFPKKKITDFSTKYYNRIFE